MSKYIYLFNSDGNCFCRHSISGRDKLFVNELLSRHDSPVSIVSDLDIEPRVAKIINGNLIESDPDPLPVEAIESQILLDRLERLRASDWSDTASAPERLGPDLYAAWQTYRQALRDITDQPGFPTDVVWPVAPS
jgi:hypothetical protein